MASTASSDAAGDVLQSLPPIRTSAPAERQEDAASSSASSSPAPEPEPAEPVPLSTPAEGGQEPEPTTPTSEESRLRTPTKCPPAPRKPAFALTPFKRTLPRARPRARARARQAVFPVPLDLSTVFRALPPKKRIRAG